MKFSNNTVRAAHALAMEGAVEAQVGDPDGTGPAWQAIVQLDRVALMRHNIDDIHYPYVKPGHSTMVWLVLDDGVVICHQSEDLDKKDAEGRVKQMMESFTEVTKFYLDPAILDGYFETDLSDFDLGASKE